MTINFVPICCGVKESACDEMRAITAAGRQEQVFFLVILCQSSDETASFAPFPRLWKSPNRTNFCANIVSDLTSVSLRRELTMRARHTLTLAQN